MSTKTFCDNCGKELVSSRDDAVKIPLRSTPGGVTFEIHSGYNKLETGEVCKYCVLDAVKRLDDRPQVQERTEP